MTSCYKCTISDLLKCWVYFFLVKIKPPTFAFNCPTDFYLYTNVLIGFLLLFLEETEFTIELHLNRHIFLQSHRVIEIITSTLLSQRNVSISENFVFQRYPQCADWSYHFRWILFLFFFHWIFIAFNQVAEWIIKAAFDRFIMVLWAFQ